MRVLLPGPRLGRHKVTPAIASGHELPGSGDLTGSGGVVRSLQGTRRVGRGAAWH